MFDLGPVAPNRFADAAIDLAALILIIERDVRVFLKDSNLAYSLGADPTRGHICHTTIFKMQSHIGDVFTPAKHWHADGIDAPQGRTHEMQNHFKIMVAHLPDVDERIRRYCENYEFRRISAVDRNVLRLAIYEMLYRDDIPPVVSINEAIELAKAYGGADSGRFVNGILDRIRKDLDRPAREAVKKES